VLKFDKLETVSWAAPQLLVRRWDTELSRDVLAHWLDLMSASGWIPREQILGAEAAVRVPVEYVTQKVWPHLCRSAGSTLMKHLT
jgi:Glycosyl hydrolase family 63 C-terminal domain